MGLHKSPGLTIGLMLIVLLPIACSTLAGNPTVATPTSTPPTSILPFSALEPYWTEWLKANTDGSLELYCEDAGGIISSGVHVEPGQSVSFDAWGMPVPPTNDGSLITFRTDNCTFGWVNGIQVQASNRLTLLVSKDTGLVYHDGSGKIVLQNGDTLVFGSGVPKP